MPPHLFEDIDIIYIGQYQDLIDRGLEALYEDGAIYITNTLSDNIDYIENIIHENAHSIREYSWLINIRRRKSNLRIYWQEKRLFHTIKSQDHDISGLDYLNPEFDQEMDDFLYKELGYDNLNYLINGLFLNPYAVTSIGNILQVD
jgi:hypothetical protein